MGKLATTVLLSLANDDAVPTGGTVRFTEHAGGGAEASGIYFGAEPGTLFVNVQYADDANDMTLAVTRE
jgi:secreted PhoX family phosphatase